MKALRISLLWLTVLALAGTAAAAPIATLKKPKRHSANIVDNTARIDINNLSMVVTNTGSFAYDKEAGAGGLEFPKGTGKTGIFAAGLWLGAQVGGKVRIAISEYSDEYQPGSAVGGVPDDPSLAEYKTYKLNRVYTDTAERDAALADYTSGAVPHGAPPVAVQTDGSLNVQGDQMLWAVYNDLNPLKHTNGAGKTLPMGIEIQQTTFAFSRQGALGNTIFIRYKLINRGANTLSNMFVSQWSDPDLGGFTDDLVGCDTTLSLGFVYNATNSDEQYGGEPPSIGYDFLQGPAVGGIPLGLASFNKYINGTDPDDSLKTYNYMLGLNANGSLIINPTDGLPTKYQVSGDPVTGAGWLDDAPADRRLQLSSGPFTMAPGDSQEVVVGIVVAQSSNRLASISLMKFYDSSVQAAYDADFNLPSPPTDPVITPDPRNSSVFLSWDTSAENYNQTPYIFEGYNVYQGASIAGPWTRVATYDVVNSVTVVLDPDFDEEQGLILPTGKAFGQNSGLRYQIVLEDDKVRGGPLNNATTYFYAVTSYSVAPVGNTPRVLESPFIPVQVVPQTTVAGNLDDAVSSPPTAGQITPGPTPSTDQVTVTVVDPAAVVTADYRVGFKPDGATSVWYVTRTVGAVTDTVLNNLSNFSGDDSYPVVDGIQIKVVSKPPGVLGAVSFTDTTGAVPTSLEGVDRGLPFFGGGAGYAAADVTGSTIPDQSPGPNVLVRFTGGVDAGFAYQYARAPDGSVYGIEQYVPVPFRVYNLDTNTQMASAFLERQGEASNDHAWNPTTASDGGREAIFILDVPYTGATSDPAFFSDPDLNDLLSGHVPIFYQVYSRRTSDAAALDEGDKFNFISSIPANSNDFYTFSTTASTPFDATAAKAELSSIKAVPNPYFAHSSYELNQFNRIVKFTHLPARCTIRLFNLAGDLVRTLEKDDNTSLLTWDLNTKNGLPVGSGIYIFHVDAPGAGTFVGKMAVFMEKERLNNF